MSKLHIYKFSEFGIDAIRFVKSYEFFKIYSLSVKKLIIGTSILLRLKL